MLKFWYSGNTQFHKVEGANIGNYIHAFSDASDGFFIRVS
ncbi:hypothetical protein SAMN04515695_3102 [Pseudovibrio sp. Tun.PSC04-5.I4]|nr:hypothetical protein SAMN04515695_3102 [Pseudovibrio sp. Tun.PSC04-5.I4]